MVKELLRALPSIDETVRDRSVKDEAGEMAHELLVSVVRSVIEGFRRKILDGEHSAALSKEVVCKEVVERLRSLKSPSLKRVVNATGTVLHTNLGRAVISKEAISSLQELSNGFINLEYDLSTTGRGERDSHIEELLKILTGAEAVCVVNNNAAAVLIALNTLADNKEVVISRGELVEIGGSFRLPDVIEKSGCILKEVGTTNRTHLDDYRNAVGDNTAVLLKAHRSNFSIQGFTSEVSLKELVTLGEERDIPVVEDLGSGSLIDLSAFGMAKEPIVAQRLSSGADVVTFSGDKLLGGPQAGLIVGKKKYIDRIKKNPLKRALRVGKLTISTLEATLRAYLEPGNVSEKVNTLRYLSRTIEEVNALAEGAAALLSEKLGSGYEVSVEDGFSQVGSGSLPGHELPSRVVVISHKDKNPLKIFKGFTLATPPVIGRVSGDKFILDPRTVESAEELCPELSEEI